MRSMVQGARVRRAGPPEAVEGAQQSIECDVPLPSPGPSNGCRRDEQGIFSNA